MHLGFEVRVELLLADGSLVSAQITREAAEQLELARNQIVYIRPQRTRNFAAAVLSDPLGRAPGLGICGQRLDGRREIAGGEVGDGRRLEHAAQARAHGDPELRERLRRALVLERLGPVAAHVRERALERAHDVGERDLFGRAGQPVAALDAALAWPRCRRSAAPRGCSRGT